MGHTYRFIIISICVSLGTTNPVSIKEAKEKYRAHFSVPLLVENLETHKFTHLAQALKIENLTILKQSINAPVFSHNSLFDGDVYTTPLLWACDEKCLPYVAFFLELGAKPNFTHKKLKNETALHRACTLGSYPIAQRLLTAGAFVNAQDCNNDTPLHNACNQTASEDITHLITLLIQNKANPNILSNVCYVPIHFACYNDNAQAVKLLMQAGADLTIPNRFGATPLLIACDRANLTLVDILKTGKNACVIPQELRDPTRSFHCSSPLDFALRLSKKRPLSIFSNNISYKAIIQALSNQK